MTRWLSIVGIGEDGLDGLSPAARLLVEQADVLVGGERHLAMVPARNCERLSWPSPLAALVDAIADRRGQRVCVLGTGDPMWYGIGVTLARRVPVEEMTVIPAPGAFSLACARLGWPLARVETLTLHGRPVERLHPCILPGNRVLILSADRTTPGRVAALLRARGYGPSAMTVLAHMGGPREAVFRAVAADWPDDGADAIPDFNTVAVECRAGPGAVLLARGPGLPDEAYRHDGQLTKREVRAATLAALAPVPGQLLWDVGAGCGSIAIEWARSHAACRAVAVEPRADRLALIADNASALGVPDIRIVAGEAPAALDGLPAPDAAFIGGGLATPGIAEACWEALAPGGRLVANAVTVEGEGVLAGLHRRIGGSLVRIAVSRAGAVGGFTGWRPLMPVTQFSAVKP